MDTKQFHEASCLFVFSSYTVIIIYKLNKQVYHTF